MTMLFDPTPFLERERAAGVAAVVAGLSLQNAADPLAPKGAENLAFDASNTRSTTNVAGVATVAGGAGFLDLPQSWQTAVAKIGMAKAPGSVERWSQIKADIRALVMRWGSVAPRLGWDVPAVFGYHPQYDDVGLVLQMHGNPIVAMTQDEAIIRIAPGRWRIVRPRVPEGTALLWRLDDLEPP